MTTPSTATLSTTTRTRVLVVAAATALLATLGLFGPARASAAASWADERGQASESTLPIAESFYGESYGFTADPSDPTDCLPEPSPTLRWTSWTSFELSAGTVSLSLPTTWNGVVAGIYPAGQTTAAACVNPTTATPVMATLPPGHYDLFLAATTDWAWVELALEEVVTPANDDLRTAQPLDLPTYDRAFDLRLATLEDGEPDPCRDEAGTEMSGSVWYSFTGPPSGHIQALSSGPWTGFALFSTTSTSDHLTFADLTLVGDCPIGSMTASVEPGQRYLLQIVSFPGPWLSSTLTLQEAPPLNVQVGFGPGDPNTFDEMRFNVSASEPITTCAIDFGDGATASDPDYCWGTITHRYATDGTYTVTATATSPDGREGTATATVDVVTHDVAVTGLSAPKNGTVGRPARVSVTIGASRYPETVRVTLNKNGATGPVEIGSVTATLPTGRHSQTLTFTYTPAPADAQLGSVTLTATATILSGPLFIRDANPTNNTATTEPIRIRR